MKIIQKSNPYNSIRLSYNKRTNVIYAWNGMILHDLMHGQNIYGQMGWYYEPKHNKERFKTDWKLDLNASETKKMIDVIKKVFPYIKKIATSPYDIKKDIVL